MTKAGKPCGGWAVDGGSTCVAHTPGLKERSLAAATRASAEKRSSAVAERKAADEDAKLTLTQRLRRDAARDAAELVSSLLQAAKADGNGAAMREVWNRIEGKVTDSLNVNAHDPNQMDEAALYAWLQAGTEAMPEGSTVSDLSDHATSPDTGSTTGREEDGQTSI